VPRSSHSARPAVAIGALAGAGLVGLVAMRIARRRAAAPAETVPSHIELPDDIPVELRTAVVEGIEVAERMMTTAGDDVAVTPGWIRVSAEPAAQPTSGAGPQVVSPS
jgi:hypothetical protein